jgi:L-amino acid N-acyltransferase YncA
LLFKNIEDYLYYLGREKKLCYVILLSNKIIGCIEIGHLSIDNDSLKYRSLSYWIDESHTKKGIMFTALSALEDSFRSQNFDYLLSQVDSKNEPSIKLMEKLHYTVKTRYSSIRPKTGEIVETTVEFRKSYVRYSTSEIEAKWHESRCRKCLHQIEQCKKHKYKRLNLPCLYITDLPRELSELTWLEELNLFGNCIEQLPEWIGNFTELTRLNLSYNKLTKLPDSLKSLEKLRHLDIRDNKLMSHPEVVKGLPNLRHFLDDYNSYNNEDNL